MTHPDQFDIGRIVSVKRDDEDCSPAACPVCRAHTLLLELAGTVNGSEQGIVQFDFSRGLAKLKDA